MVHRKLRQICLRIMSGYNVKTNIDIPVANEAMNSFDVWGWNTVDMVDMMRMQKKRYLELQAIMMKSRLTLMAAVAGATSMLRRPIRNPQVVNYILSNLSKRKPL